MSKKSGKYLIHLHLLILVGSWVATECWASDDGANNSAKKIKEMTILSGISEPEGGLIRHFIIDLSEKNEILGLRVKPEKGKVTEFSIDQLHKEEVTVSSFAGVDSVMLKVDDISPVESLLKIRYLQRIPSNFESFDLLLKQEKDGNWAVYKKDQSDQVRWIVFHSKTFLGAPIGVESYDLLKEKPTPAH